MTSNRFHIYRRAYSNYDHVADTFGVSWSQAVVHSMDLQHKHDDGEYFVEFWGKHPRDRSPSSSYQSGFDYL